MKEFFVGLLVLCVILMLSVIGVLLFPLIIVFSFFLRFVIGAALCIFAIWLLGKAVLLGMERLKQK